MISPSFHPTFYKQFTHYAPTVASFLLEVCEFDEKSFVSFNYLYLVYKEWSKWKFGDFPVLAGNRFTFILKNLSRTRPRHIPPEDPNPFLSNPVAVEYKTERRLRVVTGLKMRSVPLDLFDSQHFTLPDVDTIPPAIWNESERLTRSLVQHRQKIEKKRVAQNKYSSRDVQPFVLMERLNSLERIQEMLNAHVISLKLAAKLIQRVEDGERLDDILASIVLPTDGSMSTTADTEDVESTNQEAHADDQAPSEPTPIDSEDV